MTNAAPIQVKEPRFALLAFDSISFDTEANYLVKGVLPKEGLAVVWGPPKCGKSFWVFDVAMHVALGWQYRERRVKPGAVVYVAAEGQSGFKRRVEAFRQEWLSEDHEAPPFHLLPTRLDLIHDYEALVQSIRVQLAGTLPALVVLDTLNRTFSGSESSDEDMGAYIKAADYIKVEFSCAVVVVHHCGIEGSRPRGHTSLTGAADAQIAIKRGNQQGIVATVEWMKDGEGEGEKFASTLKTVDLGWDNDGEPITSCVIEPAMEIPRVAKQDHLKPNQETMLYLITDAGPAGIDTEALYEKARLLGIGTKRHATLHDVTRALKKKGLVHEYGGRWNVG
jgi:hypothetical protein